MKNIQPLKRFGQNYLIDQNTIQKIIAVIQPYKYDKILEIGPGKGAMTRELNKSNKNITCFEIDNRVVDELKIEFPEIEIINKDFLKIELSKYLPAKGSYIIVGNIPYNITSPILFKLINEINVVTDVVLMMQNEVARRIIAKPKTKEYGILSVILNFFAEVEYCFKIPPTVFYPKPKVDSAIVKFSFNKKIEEGFDAKLFISVVKASFGNRRKTLKNSLGNSQFSNIDFAKVDFDFSRRAEELDISEYTRLMKIIQSNLSCLNKN